MNTSASDEGMQVESETVHVAEVVDSLPSPLHPFTPSPPSAAEPTTIELRSNAEIPSKGQAQLYYQIPDATRFVGFEVEEDVLVGRIMVGSRILTLEEGSTWPETLRAAGDLSMRAGHFLTIMAQNRGAGPKVVRAVALFVGGDLEKKSPQPPVSSNQVSSQAGSREPEAGSRPVREVPEPHARVVLVVSKAQADHVRRLVGFGQRPPQQEIPKIMGRINAAIASVGKAIGETGALIAMPMSVAAAQALGVAVARNGPISSEHRTEILDGERLQAPGSRLQVESPKQEEKDV